MKDKIAFGYRNDRRTVAYISEHIEELITAAKQLQREGYGKLMVEIVAFSDETNVLADVPYSTLDLALNLLPKGHRFSARSRIYFVMSQYWKDEIDRAR